MRGERTPYPPAPQPVAITNKVQMTQQEVCMRWDGTVGGEESDGSV